MVVQSVVERSLVVLVPIITGHDALNGVGPVASLVPQIPGQQGRSFSGHVCVHLSATGLVRDHWARWYIAEDSLVIDRFPIGVHLDIGIVEAADTGHGAIVLGL